MTVKSGGVTSAAQHLKVSQPSLSSQLKVLEESLEIRLFNRVGRQNKLTPEGEVVFGFCRQMFELSEEMQELITKQIPYASRRIYIGVSHEVANSFVVEVVSLFLKQYGDTLRPKVMLISGSHERLTEQLLFREIDAVVTQLAMTNPELENLQGAQIPVNLVCSYNQKILPKKKPSDIKSILKIFNKKDLVRWVMPALNFKLRAETNQFFEKHAIKGRIVFESDVMESIVRSVQDELGMAFLPLIYIPAELKNKSLCKFGPHKGYWSHRIGLACHTQNRHDQVLQALSMAFKKACKPLSTLSDLV